MLPRLVQREEAHDEPRRAEPALRAVAVDHRLLHRMQRTVGALEALDGDELLAVERRDKLDARVDGAEAHAIAFELGQHYRARAAVALGTAFLGSGPAEILAQEVENALGRRDTLDRADPAVEREPDRAAVRRCFLPARHPRLLAASCRIRDQLPRYVDQLHGETRSGTW